MGLGDEIMALGRVELLYEQTGRPVAIRTMTEAPRDHEAWHGNPAYNPDSGKFIIDGGGARPYHVGWHGRKALFNMDHRPRAGRIYLTEQQRARCDLEGTYAIVAPNIKKGASVNKNWGVKNWERTIMNFPVPVYQLVQDDKEFVLPSAIAYKTPHFRDAVAAIERAAVVMCNEGGTHHMAASVRVPAVVVFGSFTPPKVTGYKFHYNIAVETEHGYCGNWDYCNDCHRALKLITPDMVREKALLILESFDEGYGVHRI